jgi:subtilisin family serine protease
VLALSTAALGLVTPNAVAVAAQPPEKPVPSSEKQLGSRDRGLIAAAEQAGKHEVTILVAAEKGRIDAAANELRSIGAVVQSVEKDVDYIKATLPPAAAGRAAKLDSVRAIDVDGLIARDDPKPEGIGVPIPQRPPGPQTPRVNPYMPTGDTHAAQFGQLFPFWDGKDVTVAIVDSGIDLDHPALAKTSRGERKIVDWYDANSPTSGDSTWVAMSRATFTGRFASAGRTWTAPATGGPYSFGLFSESGGANDLGSPNSELGGDVNRDGDRNDTFGVLQDTVTKQVRVDLNGNGDFTDEKAMIDYKVAQDVGFFGTDNPATPAVVERVAFVVQTDKSVYGDPAVTPLVNLGISGAEHGSHVAGITSGSDLLGGKMAGAAPGSKLMSIKACLTTSSCTDSGLTEGVLYAARNGADVVNISIGGLSPLNDGGSARAQVYNRIIAQYNVQLIISAGNSGSGANTVGDPSIATDAVSVGSYITSATWLSNYGSQTAAKEGLHPFSSRGPREDGGFKPNIVAPGSAISSVPRWQPGAAVPGTYDLPNGYAHLQGTSMAAPQATGAAALLLSAYKATHGGKRPAVTALRNAIYSSARYIDNVGAYEQGNGLFDVFGAFFLLQAGLNTDTVTSSVEVHTVLSGALATPNVGVGIHDREGVTIGKKYTRTFTFTRTTGLDRPVPYRLRWVGDQGTFSSPGTVLLPLNKPVKVDVQVDPRSAGVHSAVLRLDNPITLGTDSQIMNTVFVPQEFNAGNGFAYTAQGQIARNQFKSFFVRVPQGTTGLKIDMTAGGEAGKGQVRFVRVDPRGIPVESPLDSTVCYNPDAGGGCASGLPNSRTLANPIPGVWEFYVEARRTSDVALAPFSITATAITTQVSPNPDTVASVQANVPFSRSYSVTNSAGAFTGKLTGGPLSSAVTSRRSIGEGAQQQVSISVPQGATLLQVVIKNPSVITADLDLYLFNCTGTGCVLATQSADADSDEAVAVKNPAAGLWVALVAGFSVPGGSTDYDYTDVFTAPSLGSVNITDTDALRTTGATWNASGTVTASAVPPAGRKLRGDINVRTSDGSIVGGGQLQIDSVS